MKWILLALGVVLCGGEMIAAEAIAPVAVAPSQETQIEAVKGLITRRFPTVKDCISVELIAKENGRNVFEVSDNGKGKITVRGSNGVTAAQGLYWYLKHVCNQHLSWCGSRIDITPETMKPVPNGKFRQVVPQRIVPYMNYCTLSYSAPWWNWERWEWEIDFMALNGINMPLAMTGLEAAWYNTLRRPEIGYTDLEARSFIAPPTQMAWQWMQNLENVDAPLPMSWIESHKVLGKQIIDRERSFGMTPIQQGFSGHVPLNFIKKFPKAKINCQKSWGHFPGVAQLDPTDPMFRTFGKMLIEEQGKLFGLGGYYAADPFHESEPPPDIKKDALPQYLKNVGKNILATFQEADPNAVWVKQTWSLKKEMFTKLPGDKVLFLALNGGGWDNTKAFWGHLFVTGQLHNFGGRINLHGDIRALCKNPAMNAIKTYPDSAMGSGLFMEGIEQNPVFYDATMDMWWRDGKVDPKTWIKGYAQRRYGASTPGVMKAWNALLDGPYKPGTTGVEFSSIIAARPALNVKKSGPNAGLKIPYDPKLLVTALEGLLEDADKCGKSEGYRFDVMDVTRQMLSNLAQWQHKKVRAAFEASEQESFNENAEKFRDILSDVDRICETRSEYRLGDWFDDAKRWATNDEERKYFEKAAAVLVTYWGPDSNPRYYDYAWREWSGLTRGFYLKRWEMFHEFLAAKFDQNQEYSEADLPLIHGREQWRANDFYDTLADWELEWAVTAHDDIKRPAKTEDTIAVAKDILEKWKPVIDEAYQP